MYVSTSALTVSTLPIASSLGLLDRRERKGRKEGEGEGEEEEEEEEEKKRKEKLR